MKQSYELESILDILHAFLKVHTSNNFTMMDLINALAERSFGFILLLMALPNALLIASIPGLSTIFGSVMALTSIQMMLRLPTIWLPESMRHKSYTKDQLEKVVEASTSFLIFTERFLKPRILILTTTFLEPFLGLISFINSLWITLPIPFGNFLPGVAMLALSLGIIAKDGVFIIAGVTISFLVWLTLVFMYISIFFNLLHWLGL